VRKPEIKQMAINCDLNRPDIDKLTEKKMFLIFWSYIVKFVSSFFFCYFSFLISHSKALLFVNKKRETTKKKKRHS